jgi:hypothetical protein
MPEALVVSSSGYVSRTVPIRRSFRDASTLDHFNFRGNICRSGESRASTTRACTRDASCLDAPR